MSPILRLIPVDKGRKLNVHKTFRRRPGHPERLLNVLCTFNLCPLSTELLKFKKNELRLLLVRKNGTVFFSFLFRGT